MMTDYLVKLGRLQFLYAADDHCARSEVVPEFGVTVHD